MSRKIIGVTVGTTMNPKAIADKVVGVTSLPNVTEEDEGKILQVEEGEWAKKTLPPCDEELSQMSVNAVQNKAVAAKFAEVETIIGNIDVLLGTI